MPVLASLDTHNVCNIGKFMDYLLANEIGGNGISSSNHYLYINNGSHGHMSKRLLIMINPQVYHPVLQFPSALMGFTVYFSSLICFYGLQM